MTKTEFLQQLYNNLFPLSDDERKEIIQDFEEHFSVGIESGKTEEQICEELGSPESCAASYLQNTASASRPTENRQTAKVSPVNNTTYRPNVQPNRNQNSVNKLLWLILFVFFVICAIGVYPTAVGLMLSPIIVALAAIFMVAFVPSGLMICFLVSLSVALFSSGLLMFLLMTWLLKLSFKNLDI